MIDKTQNPFNVTRAVDFSDQQINDYWVDLPGGAGFREMAKPTSPMPMLILGGKGSGKTHLMRYFSYPLQKLRHKDPLAGVLEEGYIGVYLRCGGLNAARFTGKGQTAEKWSAVFNYYMDLWLTQLTVETVLDVFATRPELERRNTELTGQILALFDADFELRPSSLRGLLDVLRDWQREMDRAINNAAISRELVVTIRSTPGRLVFGVPKVLASLLEPLSTVQILYLLDELENLSEQQQRYVNTLVREREGPCSFKIGARLYGVRTLQTYSAGEFNKEGSEYERLSLDDHLRENKNYPVFARLLCARRLVEAGLFSLHGTTIEDLADQLDSFFEQPKWDPFGANETQMIVDRYRNRERPYFAKLRGKLEHGRRVGAAPGVERVTDLENILSSLSVPTFPLIEKLNLFLLYQEWASGANLVRAAGTIAEEALAYQTSGESTTRYKSKLAHFRSDLVAQALAECEQKQSYVGIDTFIEMSRGLPRNLLVVLKHIVQWSLFNGERPFTRDPISRKSQEQGVLEAAQWFLRDAEVLGEQGPSVKDSIRRLASLFRDIRFSDKPAECSLCAFSTDLSQVSARANRIIELAEWWSLLIRIPRGQRERNTGRLDAKFQLNSMLCPLWDLPIYRRGAVALRAHEVDAIFDPDKADAFNTVARTRVQRMTAPYFGSSAAQDNEPLLLFADD